MAGDRPTRPRIAPIKPGEETDEQKEVLAQTAMGSLNIFHTLAHYPGLLRRWLPFGGKLLQGSKLPGRDRELSHGRGRIDDRSGARSVAHRDRASGG